MSILDLLNAQREAEKNAAEKESARVANYAARVAEIERSTAAMDAAVAAGDQATYQRESINLAFARAAAEKVEAHSPYYSEEEADHALQEIAAIVSQHRLETYSKIQKHIAEIDVLLKEHHDVRVHADKCVAIVGTLAERTFVTMYRWAHVPDFDKFRNFVRKNAGL